MITLTLITLKGLLGHCFVEFCCSRVVHILDEGVVLLPERHLEAKLEMVSNNFNFCLNFKQF
jgi:hypothetical protein